MSISWENQTIEKLHHNFLKHPQDKIEKAMLNLVIISLQKDCKYLQRSYRSTFNMSRVGYFIDVWLNIPFHNMLYHGPLWSWRENTYLGIASSQKTSPIETFWMQTYNN